MLRFYAVDRHTMLPYTENEYVPTFPYMFRCDGYWAQLRPPRDTLIRQIAFPESSPATEEVLYIRPAQIQCLGQWDRLISAPRLTLERKRIVRLKR